MRTSEQREKVVIIIPTYNEREAISNILEKLEKIFQLISQFDMHILVFDSASPDGTQEIVRLFQRRYNNIHLLTENSKTGLGAAYIKAMKYAVENLQANIIFEFDADGSHQPEYIPEMLICFQQGANIVTGSRFVKGGHIPSDWQFHRKFLSVVGNLIARVILSNQIKDYTTGFRGIRADLLRKLNLENLKSVNYAYKIHLMWEVHLLKPKLVEFPIQFIDRQYGYSKFDGNNAVESLLLLLRLRYDQFKRYLKASKCHSGCNQ